MIVRLCLLFVASLTLLTTCRVTPTSYDFPRPVDTTTRPVSPHRGYDWNIDGNVYIKTNLPSGKLDSLAYEPGGPIHVWTRPENTPINMSPWYAFQITAQRDTTVEVAIHYPANGYHRYWPKLSTDLQTWSRIDSTAFTVSEDGKSAKMTIDVPAAGDPLYVAAQEIHNSGRVTTWMGDLSRRSTVTMTTVGESARGRELFRLHVNRGKSRRKPTVVILSRQHPPEVTGYLAMQAFVNGLLAHPRLNEFLASYQLLIYPLLNPDGVDAGHWRHNAGGVDLNRDWAFYHQPETEAVATDIVRFAQSNRSPIVLGLDFHSTWKDVYYTHDDSVQPPSALGDFKDRWLASIERGVGGDFRINEEAEPIGRPTSMSWFRTQFNAEGITYEIGDDTPRAFIEQKGRVSAGALIKELLTNSSR